MTNLEKFYPGTKIEDFKVDGSEYTKDIGATFAVCAMDCSECPARTFCDNDTENRTCIDTFEAWAKMEAFNG